MISTDKQLIYADITYQVRGCIFRVYNELGHGHKEQVYQKAVEFIPKTYEQQLLHYLKTTGYTLGLLVNFGSPKLYIKRLIWSNQCKSAQNL